MEDKQAVHSSVWSPLLVPVFRALWLAWIVANLGVWIQNVSGVWLMTTLTSSPVLIALMQTAISLPIFLFGLPSGTLADIVNRRTLLIVGLSIMLIAAGILGTLTLLGAATPWLLLMLTFVLNLGIALNLPIWLAVLPRLVPRKELANAISLGGVGFNLAQAVGPVLGGVIVAVIGPGAVFLFNAVLFFLTLFILIRWQNPQQSSALPGERFIGAMSAALRYLGHAPPLQRVLLRSTVFMSCASALLALLPLVAKHELNMGGLGYGLLQGCLGLGAVIGAMAMPRLQDRFSIDVLIVSATVVYAIVVVAVTTLHLVILLFVLVLIAGVAWITCLSSTNIATQQAVPKWVEARAVGLYLLFLQGSTALGSVMWGWVAARFGISFALLCSALGLVVGLLTALRWRLHVSERLDTTQMWAPWVEPHRLMEGRSLDALVLVMVEYQIDPQHALSFLKAMQDLHRIRLRDGSIRVGIYADPLDARRYVETFVTGSWDEHLRQHERMMIADHVIEERVRAFHVGAESPRGTHLIYATESWVKEAEQFKEGQWVGGINGVSEVAERGNEHLPHDVQG
jgi:MFS family permease